MLAPLHQVSLGPQLWLQLHGKALVGESSLKYNVGIKCRLLGAEVAQSHPLAGGGLWGHF